ncbi:Uncharacterised protein [Pasteurella multocida]|uniref:hypothetical protein n=1 Tax=Pasteurella multocida TaxID=747 RepID=UPI000DA2EF7A|nr:hypothetical protein [Pasteurella multocida]SQI48178.1 Uncharacterised protein [Pasteurella multocida]
MEHFCFKDALSLAFQSASSEHYLTIKNSVLRKKRLKELFDIAEEIYEEAKKRGLKTD